MKTPEMTNAKDYKSNDWSGIWALTLGVSGLMIAEFLPAGILTSLSSDLKVSEGMAGQAVTATSVFAMISSLLIAYVTRNFNRRTVLLWLSSCLVSSSLIVALAPNLSILLIGRVVLGIALGGFWSMSTAIAIRLVSPQNVPKALSIIFGGASFSAMLSAPLGSFLGDIVGWRNVFLLAAAVGVVAFIWQWIALPSLEPKGQVKLRTIVDVLKIPNFMIGLVAINLAFCGRFASFTYLRPFLEKVTGLNGAGVSGAFLVFDIAYFVGTLFAASLVSRSFRKSLSIPPLLLAGSVLGLVSGGAWLPMTLLMLVILGISFAPIPVAWSAWAAGSAPENTETAGGLYVASVQLSAAIGALLGGVVYDSVGSNGVFIVCAASWILAAILAACRIQNVSQNNLILSAGH